jgi:phosphohistidine phosphatase
MRTLLLFRHAKAERDGEADDHARSLTKRGRRDAELMGRALAATGIAPDLIVSSTAQRAHATATLARKAAGWRCALETSPALYDSSVERTLEVIHTLEAAAETVMLVGHEPTWSALGEALIGGGRLRLPTAGLVHVELDLRAWSEARPGAGTLRALVFPDWARGQEADCDS